MRILVLFALVFSVLAHAKEPDPRPEMGALAKEISSLQRFLLSDASFSSPQNAAAISASLRSLQRHLGGLKEDFREDPALAANLELLTHHLQDASRSFERGNKPFARYMLQSSLQLCIACHTRGKVKWDYALPDGDLQGASPLDQGEFYFATRQFEKGRVLFEGVVTGFPANQVTTLQLRQAMLSLAVYFARVKEDPSEGAAYFGAQAKNQALPEPVRKEVTAWAKDFAVWKKKPRALKANAGAAELLKAARALLKGDQLGENDRLFHIRRLRASALLHRALESPGGPSPAKGESLLLLGELYGRLNHELFFRFADMYFKACIREYKKTKTAQLCYGALEDSVKEGYTGSAGTSVPKDEAEELALFKRMAY